MAQSDLPGKIAQDVVDFVPAPVRKLFGAYSKGVDKLTGAVSKPQAGGHYEPNDEQKAEIEREQGRKPVGKKKVARPTKRTAPLATKRVGRKRG